MLLHHATCIITTNRRSTKGVKKMSRAYVLYDYERQRRANNLTFPSCQDAETYRTEVLSPKKNDNSKKTKKAWDVFDRILPVEVELKFNHDFLW